MMRNEFTFVLEELEERQMLAGDSGWTMVNELGIQSQANYDQFYHKVIYFVPQGVQGSDLRAYEAEQGSLIGLDWLASEGLVYGQERFTQWVFGDRDAEYYRQNAGEIGNEVFRKTGYNGGNGENGPVRLHIYAEGVPFGGAFAGRYASVYDSNLFGNGGTVTHELGHSIGLPHENCQGVEESNAIELGNRGLPTYGTNGPMCNHNFPNMRTDEYQYDIIRGFRPGIWDATPQFHTFIGEPDRDQVGATVYGGANFTGVSANLTTGVYQVAQLNQLGIGGNSISSLEVKDGFVIIAGKDNNRGQVRYIKNSLSSLDFEWDNNIEYITVIDTNKVGPVKVHADAGYGGAAWGLDAGTYDFPRVKHSPVGNDQISSISIDPGYEVTVATDGGRGGTVRTYSSSVDFVGDINDNISWIQVRQVGGGGGIGDGGGGNDGGGDTDEFVSVYVGSNFSGTQWNLGVGVYDYPQLLTSPVGNDSISSVRVPDGFEVTLTQDAGGFGQRTVLTSSSSSLGIMDNQTSWIEVRRTDDGGGDIDPGTGPVSFFADSNYGGARWNLDVGVFDTAQLLSSPIGDNNISSFLIPTGYEVILAESAGGNGQRRTYDADAANLFDFNDQASWIEIRLADDDDPGDGGDDPGDGGDNPGGETSSFVEVFAAGVTNEEIIELKIDGNTVRTWSNLGGDAYGGQFVQLNFTTDGVVDPGQIRIEFTNDLYDEDNGIDRNVRIDKIVVDGVTIETESADVFSTGTWKSADGIVPGFRESEYLHSNGYFQFPSQSTPTGSSIEMRVRGDEGNEQFNLLIKNLIVGSFSATTEYQTFRYTHDESVSADDVRIEFTNDQYDVEQGIDANLDVDYIIIDDITYQTEDPTVFSTGTWRSDSGIVPGFRESETLHTNGYFQYAEIGVPQSTGSFSQMPAVAEMFSGDGLTGEQYSVVQGRFGSELFEQTFAPRSIITVPGVVMEAVFASGNKIYFNGTLELGDLASELISLRKTTDYSSFSELKRGVLEIQQVNLSDLRDARTTFRDEFLNLRNALLELNIQIRNLGDEYRSTSDVARKSELRETLTLLRSGRDDLKLERDELRKQLNETQGLIELQKVNFTDTRDGDDPFTGGCGCGAHGMCSFHAAMARLG